MNKNPQTLQNKIIDLLKNTQMTHLKIQDLIAMIISIYDYKQQYKDNSFLLKQQQLENKLEQLYTNLTKFNELIKKKKGILTFFKQNDEINNGQQEIYKEVKQLYQEIMTFFEDSSLLTSSAYTQEKQVIDQDFITINTTIKVNHPKFLPIKAQLNLILKQDPYSDIYELVILRRFLISKIKEKTTQNLNEIQIKYLNKFDKKKYNTQILVVSYSRLTKITEISSEIYPYIITTNTKQNKLQLCKGMKLRFFPKQTLIVLETNTKNELMTHFSGVNDNINQPLNQDVQINDYGYIKFQYLEIDKDIEIKHQTTYQEQQEPQKIQSKGTTFEFFLKNSKQLISDIIPSINATLFHDEKIGFYMLPIKTEYQNYYHLYYDNYLQTKSNIYNISLQINRKGWIQIETEKEKAQRLNL